MKTELLTAIELLKKGESKKVTANLFVLPNAIVYRMIQDNASTSIRGLNYIQEILAIKSSSGVILGNSSRLEALENMYIRNEVKPTEIQQILSEVISMIPFTVFKQAGLDLMTCEIVDAGNEETLKEKMSRWDSSKQASIEWIENRHFTGARLFKAMPKVIGTRPKYTYAKYFLCDVDRREVEHNIINFFLAELPEKCGSISEAYEMLKPEEVKQAEQKGTEVLRQGEFFFLPVFVGEDWSDKSEPIRRIQVGNSRPNTVEKGFKVGDNFFVSGTISHTGREHADLNLDMKRWYKVVPNTSKANFQLTGDID